MKSARTVPFAMMATIFLLCSVIVLPSQAQSTHRLDLTPVKPETVGFSSARLERLHKLIQDEVDHKQLAGAITILARHGKIVDYRTYGQKDLASGAPMTKDTIFRDYSMTKPVTGVAMMILFEEGKWLPSDPISKHIPEFAGLKVFKGVDAEGKPILADPEHAPTMMELMSHSAGFTYGNGHTLADAMFQEKKPMQSANLQEMINKVATLPLFYEPGKRWTYSMSMDIEGYIVEKISGQSLPDFMRDHIFEPLEMKDAGFFVPADKRARFATNYRVDAQDHLVPTFNQGFAARLRGPTRRSLRRWRNGFHYRRLLPLRADARPTAANSATSASSRPPRSSSCRRIICPPACSPESGASASTSCAPASAMVSTAP